MSVWTSFVMFIFLPCALLKAHLSLRFMKYSFIIDFYPGNSSSYFSGCLCLSSFLSFFLYFKIIWYTCKQYVNGFYLLNWKSFDISILISFFCKYRKNSSYYIFTAGWKQRVNWSLDGPEGKGCREVEHGEWHSTEVSYAEMMTCRFLRVNWSTAVSCSMHGALKC